MFQSNLILTKHFLYVRHCFVEKNQNAQGLYWFPGDNNLESSNQMHKVLFSLAMFLGDFSSNTIVYVNTTHNNEDME